MLQEIEANLPPEIQKKSYSLLSSDLEIKMRINRIIMAEENFAQIKSPRTQERVAFLYEQRTY